jgi:hypothetical protein
MKGLGDSRKEVALSDIADVLTWMLAFETSQDTDFLRPGQDRRRLPQAMTISTIFKSRSSAGRTAKEARKEGKEAWLQRRGKGELMHAGNARMPLLYLST